jgi:hypothetical protein
MDRPTFASIMAGTLSRLGASVDHRTWDPEELAYIHEQMVNDLGLNDVVAIPGNWEFDEAMNKSVGTGWQFTAAIGNSNQCSTEDPILLRRCHVVSEIR